MKKFYSNKQAFSGIRQLRRLTNVIALLFIAALPVKLLAQAPAITYTAPANYYIGSAITPLTPVNTGGIVPATIYGATSIIASDFSGPWSIALDNNGHMYIADGNNNVVRKIEIATGTATTISTESFAPYGITLDPDGNIYVCTLNSSAILKIDAEDLSISYINAVSASALVCDTDGNFYLVDFWSGNLLKISADGNSSNVLASGFTYAQGIAMDAAGNIYIADTNNNAVKKVAAGTYEVTTLFETTNPYSVTVDPAGNIYAVALGTPNVTKMTPEGTLSNVGTGYSMPSAVITDADNNLLMSDLVTKTLKKIINTGYSISPALPEGLSFDPATGQISGTPTLLSAAQDYTITAYNSTGSSSTTVNIGVIIPPPAISYTTPVNLNLGTEITALVPVNTGGEAATYSIEPALPDGLSIDGTTGTISGTPTAITPATDYAVTATNTSGSNIATLNLRVVIAPPVISYASPKVYAKDAAITALVPESTGGQANSFTVDPALPAGLSIDGLTGVISGTPTMELSAANYTVTATNDGGSTTAVINIEVQLPAPAITYASPKRFTTGTAITPLAPVNTGGVPSGYSISPALPAGLSIDNTTGIISGTPTVVTLNTVYKITATNATGNSIATLRIITLLPLPVISYGESKRFTKDVTISSLTPANTGGAVPANTYGQTSTIKTGLNEPSGLAVDAAGNIYVANSGANNVRKIAAGTLTVTSLGSGFNYPTGVALDGSGNLYIADFDNVAIKRISLAGGTINTISNDFQPYGIYVDAAGNIYANDFFGGKIRKIAPDGTNTDLGSGFSYNIAVAVDAAGNVYVADRDNNAVKKIAAADGAITTLMSGFQPWGIVVDPSDNIYITNADGPIKKVSGATGAVTDLTTGLALPSGITLDINGDVFVAEFGGNKVKKVINTGYTISPALPTGLSFNKTTGVISGKPTVYSEPTDYTITANNSSGSSIAVVNIGVPFPLPAISYTTPPVYNQNTVITSLTPTNTGGAATSWTIDPALPAGLSIDAVTGVISGTPTVAAPATAYTVTATNTTGGVTATINITVLEPLPNISYTSLSNYAEGTAITPLVPVSTGSTVNTYSISPALPAGLNMDTSTGIISGTPAGMSFNVYTITATATSGTTTTTVTITVLGNIPNISYTVPAVYSLGKTIDPITPTNTGGAVPANAYGQITTLATGFGILYGVAVDGDGNVYVADYNNNAVKKIAAGTGVVSTVGSGFVNPTGLVIDANGDLLVADFGNLAIKKVVLSTGAITTVASGFAPFGITVDQAGNIYANDYFNHVVKKVAASNGALTDIGSGFGYASDVVVDAAGNVIVADSQNGMVKKISTNGTITTLISGYNVPQGIAIDAAGNIYVLNSGAGIISKIAAATGNITTVVSGLSSPYNVTLDRDGNFYVVEYFGSAKKISNTGYSISPTLPAGLTFDGATGIITGKPTVAAAATDYTITAYNSAGSNSAIINFEVKIIDPAIAYNTPQNYYAGIAITPLAVISTGAAVTLFTITPALPDGMSLNSTTGTISGTPTGVSPATDYVITAENAHGTATALVNITVLPPIPKISYATSNKFSIGNAIIPLTPSNIGGAVTQGYTISPDLPAGLTIDANTGIISGTPTTTSPTTTYTVTAVNADGSNTTSFNITVLEPLPVISYTGPQSYIKSTAITPLAPVSTGGAIPVPASAQISDLITGISSPYGVTFDKAGYLYLPQYQGIEKINLSDLSVTPIGSGFTYPFNVAPDAAGNLYISDATLSTITKIAVDGSSSVAASGFTSPAFVALDPAGNIYVSDIGTSEIKKVAAADGAVTTILSDFASYGMAVDKTGNLFATDYYNNKIIKVTPEGVISDFVTTGLNSPSGMDFDSNGNIFVVNEGGNGSIKKIKPDGTVTNFLSGVAAVAVALDGNDVMYLADFNGGIVKKINLEGYFITPALPAGLSIDPGTGVISGTPTATSTNKAYTITAANNGGTSSATLNITVANDPAPTIAGRTLPTNNSYLTGQSLNLTVTYNEIVNVTAVPYIVLTIGSTARNALYVSGSGTNTLTFRYTIVSNDLDNNGISVASSITLTGGGRAIKDAAGNNAPVTSLGFASAAGILVNYSPQTITFNALTNKTYGDANFSLVASASSGLSVSFSSSNTTIASISGSTVTIKKPGTVTITAAQAGNTNYAAATSVTQTLTINAITQTIAFAPLADKNFGDASFSLTATGGASGNPVTFSSSNTAVASISGSTVTILAAGSTNITASQAGNTNYAAATAVIQGLNVNKGYAELLITNLTQTYDGTPKAVIVVTDPEILTGVSVTYNGSSTIPTAPGTYDVVAQLNNSNYTAANASATLTINKIIQTISFTELANKTYGDADFAPEVSSTNTAIPVNLSSSNTSVATIVNGNIHILKAGTTTITATQAGDANTIAATDVAQTIIINKAPVTITAAPKTKAYAAADPALTYNITSGALVGSDGFTGSLTRDAGENASNYTINQGTVALSDNYILTYVPAPLTILPPSSNALLASLKLNPNAVLVLVAKGTTNYTASVDVATTNITVTPTTLDPTATITVNGIVTTSGMASAPISLNLGQTVINTVVTAQDGTTIKTYTVTVTRNGSNNAVLASLKLNPNAVLMLVERGTTNYTASVDAATTSITVTPTAQDANATIKVNGTTVTSGSTSDPIALSLGQTVINTVVTAQDGTTINTYSITVTRNGSNNATLTTLKLNPNTALVVVTGASTKNYTTSVDAATTAVTVTAIAQDANATITINGITTVSGAASAPIALGLGQTVINTIVTAQDGTTINTYTITVTRNGSNNATLTTLKLNPNTALVAVAGSSTKNYTTTVDPATTSITVIAATQDENATIKINGQTVTSGSASNPIALSLGQTVINAVVTAQDGTTINTYTIAVTRNGSNNATLSALKLDPNAVLVAVAGTKNYTTSVDATTTSVTVMPTAQDANATITVNGAPVTSGSASSPVALSLGQTVINTVVTAQDGTVNTYVITVTRNGSNNATLTTLKLDPNAILVAVPGSGTKNYTASVDVATTNVTVTPVAQDANATIKVNGIAVTSGMASDPITLGFGQTIINTEVTAQDGTTISTYVITVTRNGSNNSILTGLKLNNNAVLVPVAKGSTNYITSVDPGTTSVMVTPTAQDANATITVNGISVNSGATSAPIVLNTGQTVITTIVTAQDGTTTTYTITVSRNGANNAALKDLKIKPKYELVLVEKGTTNYTTTVDAATATVTILAITMDPNATITTNGIPVASGALSAPITLNYGDNVINTIVTAQDGTTTRIYTITVTRPTSDAGRFSVQLNNNTLSFGGDEINSSLINAMKPATVKAPAVIEELTIPTGISPNGDGANDYLVINGITQYPDNKITIMTKTGTTVFQATGYNNTEHTFDGSSPNGDRLPVGTYFYRLQYKTGKQTKYKTGFVMIAY